MPHLHNTRADTYKQHAILLILHAKLGNDDIHSCLGRRVQRADIDLDIVGQVKVGQARGDGDDLLGLALEDLRDEEVE
jgi:hypothetical protein